MGLSATNLTGSHLVKNNPEYCACGCGTFIGTKFRTDKKRVRYVRDHFRPHIKMERTEFFCDFCGKSFHRLQCEIYTEKKFCSSSCRASSNGRRLKNDILYKEKMRNLALKNNAAQYFPIQSGETHSNWKGGISSQNQTWRAKGSYKEWRTSIYCRDKFTCRLCGRVGGQLHAHHLNESKYFPQYRLEL